MIQEETLRQYEERVRVMAEQIEDLMERLEASKAGALRYQIKFETLSEFFARVLDSTKQERY